MVTLVFSSIDGYNRVQFESEEVNGLHDFFRTLQWYIRQGRTFVKVIA